MQVNALLVLSVLVVVVVEQICDGSWGNWKVRDKVKNNTGEWLFVQNEVSGYTMSFTLVKLSFIVKFLDLVTDFLLKNLNNMIAFSYALCVMCCKIIVVSYIVAHNCCAICLTI